MTDKKAKKTEEPKVELTESEIRLVNGIYTNLVKPLEMEFVKLQLKVASLEARTPSKVHKVTDVAKFIAEHENAIVDFYSDHCMPCHKIAPALEKAAMENNDVAIGKLNIDKYPKSADAFDVKEIPLLISFQKGEIVQTSLGAPSKASEVQEMVDGLVQRLRITNDEFTAMFTIVGKVALAKGWELNPDEEARDIVLAGLALNKKKHGKAYCPCKIEKIPENICPCRPVAGVFEGSEADIKKQGMCFCGLFMKENSVKKKIANRTK